MSDPKHPRLIVLLVFTTLAFVGYGWSTGGGFLNWDDPTYIGGNHELRAGVGGVGTIFASFHFANYNPLHRLSYLVEWQCFGDNPTAFRITNLLLHLGNGLLLFALLRTWRRSFAVALAAGALFLVHPANVESVAWISERKTLLATGFAFGSLLCWLRARDGMRHARWLAWGLFTLGMLSKTSIVVLPALLLVIDVADRQDWRRQVKWYAAFLVPAVILAVTQVLAAAATGAVRPLHGGSLLTHLATVVAVLPYYLLHLVFPFGLSPRHPFEPASLADPRCWLGVLTLAAVGWGVLRSWRGERRFAVASLWCLAALSVTLLVPIPIILADRYWYFAMPLLLAVFLEAASRLPRPAPRQVQVALGVLVAVLTVATASYAAVWRNSTALWTHTLARRPGDVEAWVSLGAARSAAGDPAGAMQAYRQALRLAPTYAQVTESLAGVEMQAGQLPAARSRLAELLAREPARGQARAMYAVTFDLQGDTGRAAEEFAKGLRAAPDDPRLLLNYANFCERHHRRSEARRALQGFVDRHPHHAGARAALQRLGQPAGPPR